MADLSEKRFLSELSALTQSLQQEIEARKLGLDPSPEAIRARRRRVLVDQDFWFFCTNYFPHHVWGPASDFQQGFSTQFPARLNRAEGCKEWFIAPRGETKSTLITKLGPVFVVTRGVAHLPSVRAELGLVGEPPTFLDYIVLLGAETKMPTKLLEVVKTELEYNTNLAMDFPEVCGRGKTWRIGDAITKNGVKLEPFGAEQAIRGTFHGASRPKVIFGDDIITDSEAKSPTERDNRWNWLEKAIDYLGPPDGSVKVFFANTILDKDDPPSRAKKAIGHTVHHYKAIVKFPTHMDLWDRCEELMRNDDFSALEVAAKNGETLIEKELPSYRFYLKNKKKMDRGAVTSWPEVRSLYWLMKQRAKNKRAFGTEMQGEPRGDEDRVFTDIRFWVQKLNHWIYFMACDPSMGKGETSDPSAILVGAWDTESKKLNVVEESIKRRVPSKLGADLIAFQREFSCPGIAFENNNAYEHMRTDFIRLGVDHGVSLPLIGVTATVPPEVRIDSLEPFINGIDPRIIFHAGLTHLLDEMDTWPEKQSRHHYDGLVALHLLWATAVSRQVGFGGVVTGGRRKSVNTEGY